MEAPIVLGRHIRSDEKGGDFFSFRTIVLLTVNYFLSAYLLASLFYALGLSKALHPMAEQ